MAGQDPELAAEQAAVAVMYRRLDQLRDEAARQLRSTRMQRPAEGDDQAMSERDSWDALWSGRLVQLNAVDEGLCFGRLDLAPGAEGAPEQLHLGRIGLSEDQRVLLVDWRAPAAEPFYRATTAEPMGATRRRHLRTRGRDVTGYDDEWLDLDAVPLGTPDGGGSGLTGEAALLAALSAARTGRMRDVVATLQAEQDRVVRADRQGVLVVQGGPGTGKTAVALHRAAYLLYTHRERLASSGVLVVGPNPVFLRYVEQVLPALGETAVVLTTVGGLVPGVEATGEEPDEVAALKGGRRVPELVEAGLRARQRLLPEVTGSEDDWVVRHEGRRLRLSAKTVEDARRRARDSRRLHNPARNVFARHVLTALARQAIGRADWGEMEKGERDQVLRELVRLAPVRQLLQRLWPHLTPEAYVRDLWADAALLAQAAPWLTPAQVRLLVRDRDAPLTPADVPVVDEAAELLGETDPLARRRAEEAAKRARGDVAAAEAALQASEARGMVDAATLASRFAGTDALDPVADRARADRTWAYGHVVVDEAQELSWMAWRAVVRRVPTRSMTVVGDVAQASSPWATTDWAPVVEEHAPGRWRVEELTVGYRTPAEVMELAGDVLAAIDPSLTAPRAVRESGHPPRLVRAEGEGLAAAAARAAADELAAVADEGGRVAVLAVPAQLPDLRAALAAAGLGSATGSGVEDRVALLAVGAAKGLEFDAVVVVEPAAVVEAHPRGLSDLYVAVTRPTQRLAVVAGRPLPAVLARLER